MIDQRGTLAERPITAVAICTRNRADSLARVGANVASERPRGFIVVVDASDDEATNVRCQEIAALHPELVLKYVRAERPGLARQRNQAARLCADLGIDIVHYLDDDAEVLPGYFDAVEKRFAEDPQVGGVGGLVQNQRVEGHPVFNRVFLLSGRHPNTILKSGRVVNPQPEGGARRRTGARPVQWLQGFAMSYRVSVLREYTFDDRLTGYSYGEDRDFSFRVGQEWRLAVAPEARCLHLRAAENRHNAQRLAFESTVFTYAWVREHRAEGFSTLAFLWSAVGDLIRHVVAAATSQPGVAGDPVAYARGVVGGLMQVRSIHTIADAVELSGPPGAGKAEMRG